MALRLTTALRSGSLLLSVTCCCFSDKSDNTTNSFETVSRTDDRPSRSRSFSFRFPNNEKLRKEQQLSSET